MVKRPTPEEFLEIAHQEDRLEKRGKLKIFLGAVPGVGKTYTMLEEALSNDINIYFLAMSHNLIR